MKNKLLLILILGMSIFSACHDDDKPEAPPTIDDIVATYSSDKLQATANGKNLPSNAAVNIIKETDETSTIKLLNIVPGVPEFAIPNATFEAVSKSAYYSKLEGSVTDSIAGYDVQLTGSVEAGILSATITITDMGGESIDATSFYNKTYKGEMTIKVSNLTEPVVMTQRIYTSRPSTKEKSRIQLEINNFSFSGMSLGTIKLDTLPVLQRGRYYSFKSIDQEIEVQGIGKVQADVNGVIVGNNIQLSLIVKAGPLTVNVSFDGESVTESTDMKATITINSNVLLDPIAVSGSNYTFKVWDSTPTELLVLLPEIEIPAGATLDSVIIYNAADKSTTPIDNKTAIDFSKFTPECYVAYYITAEDVRKNSIKKLFVVKIEDKDLVYTMENWNSIGKYFEPAGLTSSNTAASLFSIMGIPVEPYPVSKAEDGAAKVITRKTVSETSPSGMVPAMTAGTLFNGEFKLNILDQLKSTKFGVPYRKKPVSLKVSYKYTPGALYYKTEKVSNGNSTINTAVEMPNAKDTCSINAYLYEVSSYDETLDGSNINTSPSVIMKASLIDGNSTSSYTERTINFTETGNGTFDPSKKYKLAIVCTPSKDGDQFMGAESTLWIKHMEIISE